MSRKEMPVIVYGGDSVLRWEKMRQLFPESEYDFVAVQRKGDTYGIDDVRRLLSGLELRVVGTRSIVYYFQEPGILTAQAQQALLLLLEDIPLNTRIVFLSNRLSNYLPTIVSRCVAERVANQTSEMVIDQLPSGSISEGFQFASHYVEKEHVELLLRVIMLQLRSDIHKKNVRDAVVYLQQLARDVQTTNVTPRVVAELASAVYLRVRK